MQLLTIFFAACIALAPSLRAGEPPPDATADAGQILPGGPGGLRPNPLVTTVLSIETAADFGATNGSAVVTTIRPNFPLKLGGEWVAINRIMIPVAYLEGAIGGLPGIPAQSNPGSGPAFGLSDINYNFLFTRTRGGPVHWSLGPSVSFPTASDPLLGTEKWSAGFGCDLMVVGKPWAFHLFTRQLWSVAGKDDRAEVNQTMLRPTITYGLGDGWYLITDPIILANWRASSGNRWTLPLGGGFGRAFEVRDHAFNANLRAYYMIKRPQGAPDWSINLTLGWVF